MANDETPNDQEKTKSEARMPFKARHFTGRPMGRPLTPAVTVHGPWTNLAKS